MIATDHWGERVGKQQALQGVPLNAGTLIDHPIQGRNELLRIRALPGLLDELASLPVRVLLTLGGVLASALAPAPANVTVRGSVPHESVLPHIAVVVTHAGMSTVATALAAGVPMRCVPQGRDQPLNAARVQELGAGLMIAADAAPRALANAVQQVLGDPSFRAAARRLAASTAAVGNGELAADLEKVLIPDHVTSQNSAGTTTAIS